ncbi:MAG: MOSC domain-containing protein [Pseudomonadota bacterium]|nr:MOSC domain-containing protein [Pseudomonadota bacterium]
MATPLLSLRIGQVQAFGPAGQPSAIGKLAVSGRIAASKLGLAGDEQADSIHHGGIDKALHHYPFEHYAAWARELPAQAALFEAGGFGENLSTRGLDEGSVCLGDVFQIDSAIIQVSQGRKPCWKLNQRFGVADMARRVQDSGRTGWYYRVLVEGNIAPDAELTLIERPQPEWTLARLIKVIYHDQPDRQALAALAKLDILAPSWREMAKKRLATGRTEDWLRRLVTPKN